MRNVGCIGEADIFLEKRSSTGSVERNAFVSVMLRVVEYFKGVLFLTSNRVDEMDPAFKTRITLAFAMSSLMLRRVHKFGLIFCQPRVFAA